MVIVSKKLKTSCDDDKPIFKRSFTEFSFVNFNQDLRDLLHDFLLRNIKINENNFDQLFNQFLSIITQTIDKHVPLKKLTMKQTHLQRRSWITKRIFISTKHKQRIHKTHSLY